MVLLGEDTRSLPAIILWGIFGGGCSAAAFFLLQWIWDVFLPDDSGFSTLHDGHILIAFTLLFAILGFLAGELFSTGKKPWEIRIGIISGISTAVVFMAILAILMNISGSEYFSEWLILLIEVLVASVILQTIGAWFHEPRRSSVPEEAEIPQIAAISKKLPKYSFLFIAILGVLIIPPCLLYFSIASGLNETTSPCCYEKINPVNEELNVTTRFAEVNRTSSDSVRIGIRPDPGTARGTPVDIHYDWEDISTPRHITGLGLNISMNPPDRLLYLDGDYVTLNGMDMFSNGTATKRLVVIDTDPTNENGSTILYSGYI